MEQDSDMFIWGKIAPAFLLRPVVTKKKQNIEFFEKKQNVTRGFFRKIAAERKDVPLRQLKTEPGLSTIKLEYIINSIGA